MYVVQIVATLRRPTKNAPIYTDQKPNHAKRRRWASRLPRRKIRFCPIGRRSHIEGNDEGHGASASDLLIRAPRAADLRIL